MTDYHYEKLPDDAVLRETLRMYVEEGYQPGGFLVAVLSNDLFDALARADPESREQLPAIVQWIYNNAPRDCWGSLDRVRAWQERFWPTEARVNARLDAVGDEIKNMRRRPGNRLDDGSNEAIADREDFDDHELNV